MSHIQRLSIQGIRSFSPDEPQEIRFEPLTIILGPNGAGKTSIIESLKYVTTGIMPPNSNAGKTFIHDVQFTDQTLVRAQIRLMFLDVENKQTIITRSMQSNLKIVRGKSQVTFRQMNSVIKRCNQSIDQKLADINKELLRLIGVSKSVLTHVIFCHQEDTNWPLSEGKILKEKFDEIFESTDFSKALEIIKKYRDEQVRNLKLLEKDVQLVKQIKKEAQDRRLRVSEIHSKIKIEKDSIGFVEKEISSFESKSNSLNEKEQETEELMNKISSIESSILEKRKLIESIQSKCSDRFASLDKQQINEELENFDQSVEKSRIKKIEIESKMKEIDGEHQRLLNEDQKFSFYSVKISDCETKLIRLHNDLKEMICEFSLKIPELDYFLQESDESRSKFFDEFHSKIKNETQTIEKKSKDQKEKFIVKENELLAKLDRHRDDRNKTILSLDYKRNQSRETEESLMKIKDLMEDQTSKKKQMQSLRTEIDNLKEKLALISSQNDEIEFKNQSDCLENRRTQIQQECEDLEKELVLSNANNESRIKFKILNSQKNEIEVEIASIQHKHSEIFFGFKSPNDVEEKDLLGKLREKISKTIEECGDLNKFIMKKEQEYDANIVKLKNLETSCAEKTQSLDKISTEIREFCSLDEFDDYLCRIESELQQLRCNQSITINLPPVLRHFIENIKTKKYCPVCENHLDRQWSSKKSGTQLDLDSLISKLESEAANDPNEIDEQNSILRKKEKIFEKLSDLNYQIQSIDKLKENIEWEQNEIEDQKKLIENLELKLDEDKIRKQSLEEQIQSLQNVWPDFTKYDSCLKNLKEINQKIAENVLDFDEYSMQDHEFKQKRFQEKRAELQQCDSDLSRLQRNFIAISNEKDRIQNLLQSAEKRKNEFEKNEKLLISKIQTQDELKEKLAQLEADQSELIVEKNKFDCEIAELQNNLESLRNQFDSFKETQQKMLHHLENSAQNFNRMSLDFQHYFKELRESNTKVSKEYLNELKTKMSEIESLKTKLTSDLERINQALTNFELDKRDLIDRQTLLRLEQEILNHETSLTEFKEKIGPMNLSQMKRIRQETERRIHSLIVKKDSSLNRIRDFNELIDNLNAELRSEIYANSEKKYRQKVAEKIICELICEDLDKYYKVLDFSISTFHKNKMEAINKLIEQFWKVSYQGKDIDSLQIIADEEERSASDKRRTYNYRVVMVKKRKMLDMRGRCSAGQKVLASLIIRMALAIIFSNNFTIITLDEPTTNLDADNIRSFAKAIMALRKMNSKLQIVIITHDEDFLKCLADENLRNYYKVSKNQEGYSTIALQTIE
ncbi:DNA repair protein RAD50 [Sarcoptes scabiei]|uniref:DNA repair protein RAD50 n=1 Tax=Sarcoptes scabiei TaxID=52283 RepID=A0A834R3Y9_SARSC|nr:DNA repair protein RAD50 [Sarcoptes scabiei]